MRRDDDVQAFEQCLIEEIQRLTERRDLLVSRLHGGHSWKDSVKTWGVFLLVGVGLLGLFTALQEGITLLSTLALCIGGVTVWFVLVRERHAKLDREALGKTMGDLAYKIEKARQLRSGSSFSNNLTPAYTRELETINSYQGRSNGQSKA